MKLGQLTDILLSLIFPLRCVTCTERIKNGALCNNCQSKIIIREGFTCPICRRRSKDPYFSCHKANFLLLTSTSFNQKEIQDLVHTLKYRNLKSSAEEMANIMSEKFKEYLVPLLNPEKTFLVPTPLHPQRLRERGFNQSELLTFKIAEKLGSEWQINKILKRIKNNKSQTECKNKKERADNVQGIFEVSENLKNYDVIIIDDVYTSGATTQEIVKTLKAAGAGRIIALIFAEA
jgi:ComF family protein